MSRFTERMEQAAADPNNLVILPEESGLGYPIIIWGGGKTIGRAFGEIAKERREREALQRKEKSYAMQADCQGLAQTQPETI